MRHTESGQLLRSPYAGDREKEPGAARGNRPLLDESRTLPEDLRERVTVRILPIWPVFTAEVGI